MKRQISSSAPAAQGFAKESRPTEFHMENYELLEKIGEGGFGQVFKARNIRTQQWVAIKFLILNNGFDQEKKSRYMERFERETLLSSRLQHPNIVRLLDKGRTDGGSLYAVFEYVEGQSLRQKLDQDGPLLPIEAAAIMAEVLDALAHAHEHGVIHRDIKPSNIMLTRVGARTHAKVLDFGISTLAHEARHQGFQSLTLTRETLGTPSYCAPEQLRGEPPTPKTDLYVWALVFIECVTGQPAVSGSSLASIFHKQLSQSNIPLPPALAGHPVGNLLRRMLAKKTGERIGSAKSAYHEFTQINFATLVGDLHVTRRSTLAKHEEDEKNAETLVDDAGLFNSGLTERKKITSLCLILNIDNLSGVPLDAEVLDALHRDQKNQAMDIATQYGAYHVGTLADTMIFYYGYPAASDSDMRLAARTALEICSHTNKRNALLRQSPGVELIPRIGMHTGFITVYPDALPEGETSNVAIELARQAKNHSIFCTQPIKDGLDTYIEFDQQDVIFTTRRHGRLYNLTGERQQEALGFLRASRQKHQFIGRETELSTLLELVSGAHQRLKRSAHVFGEAGIGKSRLIFELRNAARKYDYLTAQCLPEHKNSALHPILDLVRHKLSLDLLDADLIAAEFQKYMSADSWDKSIPILCSWLNLAVPPGYAPSAELPEMQKRLLFMALSQILTTVVDRSLHQGNLVLFEDMHWADPTTLEFIGYLLDSDLFRHSDSFFVSTSRLPLPDALRRDVYVPMSIKGLDKINTSQLIHSLFNQQQVSLRLANVIIERTDGIPLFIEELVNMLKQNKLVQHINGITDFVSPDKIDDVPANLRDSLQQKLDSLLYAKETAQLAATIGREFGHDLVVAASARNEEQVQNDLQELIERELIFQQRRVSGDSYIFKHALVRDAAYDSMLLENRCRAHRSVAAAIENHFPDMAQASPFTVARHYADGTVYDKAIEYGIRQVKRSRDLSANKETMAFCAEVLRWNDNIGNEKTRRLTELELHNLQFPASMAVNGFGSAELVALSRRIEELYADLSEDGQSLAGEEAHFLSQWVLFVDHQFHSRCHAAIDLANKIIVEAQLQNHRQHELLVLPLLGQTYHLAGELDLGRRSCERALAIYDEDQDFDLWKRYGMEVKSQALFLLSHILACQGYIDTAAEKSADALRWSKKTGCTMFIDGSYLFSSMVAYLGHDRGRVTELEESHRDFHKGVLNPEQWLVAYSMMGYDWAKQKTDHHAAFVDMLLAADRSGALCWWEAMLAETEIRNGSIARAIDRLTATLARCEKNREVGAVPLLCRTLAMALFARDRTYTAEIDQYFAQGIAEAQRQSARWLELDCLFHQAVMRPDPRCAISDTDGRSVEYRWRDVLGITEGSTTSLMEKIRRFDDPILNVPANQKPETFGRIHQ